MGSRFRAALVSIVAIWAMFSTSGAYSQTAHSLPDKQQTVDLVIELVAPPAATIYSTAQQLGNRPQAVTLQTQQQVTLIDNAQQRLLLNLARLNAQVIYRTQRVYNGIAVKVDQTHIAEISRMPGVKAVHRLIPKHLLNTASVPLIGAPALWSLSTGYTGSGIEIAVIDTGIDYVHKMFGGSGNYTGVTDTSAFVPTAKVTKGYDFVGDAYDGSNTPIPDGNPLDCNGHGSHVAGTAAGFGILSNGNTFAGPWNSTTHANNVFRIGPGVAPQASLIGLRVFGCSGSTNVVDQALEWAVDPNNDGDLSDHVDVVNMSLGSDYGSSYDSTSVASENAVAAGVIVVASAGNSADTHGITGSPGSSDSVISVAASNQSAATLDAISVNAPAAVAGLQAAAFSAAYAWDTKPDVTGNVYYPATNRTACGVYSPGEAASIAGKIVLVDWSDGECGSVTRTGNVVTAGGIGAILIDNSDVFDLSITGSGVIPAVSMPKSVGDTLKANLVGLNITFSGSYRNQGIYNDVNVNDVIASFSSRGTSRSGVLKPDIAAPGVNIFSTLSGSGDKGESLNGTSMAAPHVAGAMALLRQIHPDWSVQQLKALVMNGAVKDVRIAPDANSSLLGPARVGAGRIDLPSAAGLTVLAYNAGSPNLVGVSFGNVEVVGSATLTRTVTLVNKGSGAQTLNLAYSPSTTIPGVSYNIQPAQVTLAAGATSTASVVMTASAAAMRHVIDPTMQRQQNGVERFFISEASGYLVGYAESSSLAYKAALHGYYENPQVNSPFSAQATFTFNTSTNALSYQITFNQAITLSSLGGHIHRGAAGLNGPIAYPLAGTTGATVTTLADTIALSVDDVALLKRGELYVNFHTASNSGGELRAQIVPAAPLLRLPIYASARPASNMSGAANLNLALNASNVVTGTITLSGSGLDATNTPTETLSVVSVLELAHSSPRTTATNVVTSFIDLQYVGVGSDITAAKPVADSIVLFGVTTYAPWSSANEVEFAVEIDTNKDGINDYRLYSTNSGSQAGSDATDTGYTLLQKLNANGAVVSTIDEYALNELDPATTDTQPYNTNMLILAVYADDLGLNGANSSFNYRVVSISNVDDLFSSDSTPILTYNIANPGIDLPIGLFGQPMFKDLPNVALTFGYDQQAALTNNTRGLLVLHHHNIAGKHVETFRFSAVSLPLIVK